MALIAKGVTLDAHEIGAHAAELEKAGNLGEAWHALQRAAKAHRSDGDEQAAQAALEYAKRIHGFVEANLLGIAAKQIAADRLLWAQSLLAMPVSLPLSGSKEQRQEFSEALEAATARVAAAASASEASPQRRKFAEDSVALVSIQESRRRLFDDLAGRLEAELDRVEGRPQPTVASAAPKPVAPAAPAVASARPDGKWEPPDASSITTPELLIDALEKAGSMKLSVDMRAAIELSVLNRAAGLVADRLGFFKRGAFTGRWNACMAVRDVAGLKSVVMAADGGAEALSRACQREWQHHLDDFDAILGP